MNELLINIGWLIFRIFDHVKFAHILIVSALLSPYLFVMATKVPFESAGMTGMIVWIIAGLVLFIYERLFWKDN